MTTEAKKRSRFSPLAIRPQAPIPNDGMRDLYPRIEHLLFNGGDRRDPRRYTLICIHECVEKRPEVRVSQEAISVELVERDGECAIHVHDTYGHWELGSRLEAYPSDGQPDEVVQACMYAVIGDGLLQVRLHTLEEGLAWWYIQVEEQG